VDAVPAAQRRSLSVADHIHRLLEARGKMVFHLPDYGMPDIGELFRRLPASASEIQESMESLVRRHEPRLENVRVEFQEFDPERSRVRLRISGTMEGAGRIRFESSLFPDGRGEVRPPR
jgi:type VI secretion system protein